MLKAVMESENAEKDLNNLPITFCEMFKNEINANEEHQLYNGVKRVIKKYSGDNNASSAISEFARVLTGGAPLEQVFMVAREEASDPTPAVELSVDESSVPTDRV